MNIIKVRQAERKHRIGIIEKSIKEAENPDIKKLIMMCCSEWGISIRVCKEYVKIAQFNLKNGN